MSTKTLQKTDSQHGSFLHGFIIRQVRNALPDTGLPPTPQMQPDQRWLSPGSCRRTIPGQHLLLSLRGNCPLGSLSPWFFKVVLYGPCCAQQDEHPPTKIESRQSADKVYACPVFQKCCQALLWEQLSLPHLGDLTSEVVALLCWHRAGNSRSTQRGSGYFVLPLCLCMVLLRCFSGVGDGCQVSIQQITWVCSSRRKRCEAQRPPAAALPFWRVLQSLAQLFCSGLPAPTDGYKCHETASYLHSNCAGFTQQMPSTIITQSLC